GGIKKKSALKENRYYKALNAIGSGLITCSYIWVGYFESKFDHKTTNQHGFWAQYTYYLKQEEVIIICEHLEIIILDT
ncbi:MAG: hypothetical protein AN484_26210, partial [Aphanizomenon flos-aquae WA102]